MFSIQNGCCDFWLRRFHPEELLRTIPMKKTDATVWHSYLNHIVASLTAERAAEA
jgi:hypothetical protein